MTPIWIEGPSALVIPLVVVLVATHAFILLSISRMRLEVAPRRVLVQNAVTRRSIPWDRVTAVEEYWTSGNVGIWALLLGVRPHWKLAIRGRRFALPVSATETISRTELAALERRVVAAGRTWSVGPDYIERSVHRRF